MQYIDRHTASRTKPLQGIQLGVPNLPNPVEDIHAEMIRLWISICNSQHGCYPPDTTFLPTRLLDVGSATSKTFCLTTSSSLRSHGPARYTALSHRWGLPGNLDRFCAYTSNLEKLATSMDDETLPQTFLDAVKVTRGLGIRYIWIDSVCIVQDDPDDWQTESKLMERVFSSAYCTIVATCAANSRDGFLKARPGRDVVKMRAGKAGGAAAYYVCQAIDDFGTHVEQSELSKRGWVLQERALSRRSVYFTEYQTYWECGKGVRCETMTKMKKYLTLCPSLPIFPVS